MYMSNSKKRILEKYDFGKLGKEEISIENIPKAAIGRMRYVGVEPERASGLYMQLDHNAIYTSLTNYLKQKGVILMSTYDAYQKIPWVRKYFWNALPKTYDEFTKLADEYWRHGYFIYVPPNTKIEVPIQACLFISKKKIAQPVHNVIIVDKNSELNLVTGCATMVNEGLHLGISEFYVKENAKLTFTMIHGWAPEFEVRPRAAAIVEKGGMFVSYYVNLYPVRDLQMYPTVYLKGNANCYMTNILLGRRNSSLDVGSRIVFLEKGSKGEIISRSIVRDEAKVIMRGNLVGKSGDVKGHLECKGLILSPKASAVAVPQLESYVEGAELTHEAAIGRISEEQLYYLMSKGFTEEEAVSLIVRGFIEVGLTHLPEVLQSSIRAILSILEKLAKG